MAFSVPAALQASDSAIVVDNSVMMRWLFNDGSPSGQSRAKRVLESVSKNDQQILVPYVWVYESAFVVNFYTQKGNISRKDGAQHLKALFNLSTIVRGEELPDELYQFSSEFGLSSYDAAYILLARQVQCQIATLDKKIITVSKKLEIPVFE